MGTLTKQYLGKDRKIIQDFNTKLKNRVKETIVTNEEFLYAFCINATIQFERESYVLYDEEDDSKFFDNVKAQVKKYQSNSTVFSERLSAVKSVKNCV